MEQPALLEMRGISKEFPGVKALDNVSLTVRAGTVHALMGENGAGKSTLMKCLFGIYSKDSGTILLDGKEVNFKSSKEALENGVAMVHQELNQALTRTVKDNLWLGRYPKVGGIMVSERIMDRRTKEIFDTLEVSVNPKAVMSTLPVSQRQMVEIAKAVSYDSKIIVFDEPTSSLTETEVEHLFRIIDMLKKKGCGIIYISHKMDEILRISDDVTIMRDGTWVATRPANTLTMDEIIRLMVGRELTNRFPPKTNKPGEVILDVQHIAGKYTRLKDATFQLKKGEVLGIAGCIVLTGTDLSAGRAVGITACVAASLLQASDAANKMWPNIGTLPIPLVILIVVGIGALIGAFNGFFVAKFKLHPFIVTLATQLILYTILLLYVQQGNNNGMAISGLDQGYRNFVVGNPPLLTFGSIQIPN